MGCNGMLKVFLVEDEFVIREGIKNNINWGDHGYEFCGEAGDGELAYSMIQKTQPDILITDIRMPFMDGLTLSRMVKTQFPQIEIILLTGYEDFEYAKEAIRIGVASYLSKPISGDNLLKEIDGVGEKINKKKLEQEIARRYEEDMKERMELDKQEFFEELVTGSKELSYLLDKAGKLSIDLSALSYNIVIVKWWSRKHDVSEFSGSVLEVENGIKEIVHRRGALLFDLKLQGKAILFRDDSNEKLMENLNGCVREMKALFAEYPNIRYFGGVGQCVGRITDIPEAYNWASRAFAHLYLSSTNEFLFGTREILGITNENIILSEVDPKHIDRKLIKEFLRRGDTSETEYFLEEFFNGMGKNAMRSTMLRQYIAMDVYFCVTDFIKTELMLETPESGDLTPARELMADEASTCAYLKKIVNTAISLRKDNCQSQYRDVVNQVINYIDENYGMDELSLNHLAAYVNFSPNHLSAVFRQQTGQTFIKYLTDFRMEKAKELLLTTSKKSNEVGLLVGYKDPHYFSYLFKKTQGLTTTQYRGGINPEDDE